MVLYRTFNLPATLYTDLLQEYIVNQIKSINDGLADKK